MAWDFIRNSDNSRPSGTAPTTTTVPSNTSQWGDWLRNMLNGGGSGNTGGGTNPTNPTTPTNPLGWEQPKTTMSMSDFTNWLYRNLGTGAWNTAGGMQDAFNAAQQARTDTFNNYSGAVQGYQQAAGDLFGQMRDALGGYNSFDWNNMLATGQVPEATRQYYQQMRDAQVANLQSDLTKQFNEQFGPLKEALAARGVWDSTLGSRAVGDLMQEKARLMAQGSNTANAQMAQNLVEAPYRMMQGAGANLGNVLQSLAQQGALASSVFAPMQNQFAMSGDMVQIPVAAYQTYMSPLMDLWGNLLNAETQRQIGLSQNSSGGTDWGGLLGGVIGAFF